MMQGKFAEADSMFKRSLAMLEWAVGPKHADVAITLTNLAHLLIMEVRLV